MNAGDWVTLALLVAVAIALAALVARLVRVPYTVALVIAGLLVGLLHGHAGIPFSPSLVMYVFLPPLLFAAAWEMDLALLARWWLPIALLATAGVGAGVAIAYAVLRFGGHVDAVVAIAFGALVAATDPVAVIALFRELRVDRAVSTIVEGESLFNDGVAVVLVRALVVGAVGGAAGAGAIASTPPAGFDLRLAAESFAFSVSGGTLMGMAAGLFATSALRLTRVPAVEAVITVVAAFGVYALGEVVHVSGIIAVIVAGITCSVARSQAGANAIATVAVDRFWEGLALVANSVLFVLVGLAIDVPTLVAAGAASAWGIVAVLAGRAVIVYVLMAIASLAGQKTPLTWRHAIALGGLRGALSMALVLGLPENFHDRPVLVAMVYSVVLFTLVVQGIALRPAMSALGLGGRRSDVAEATH